MKLLRIRCLACDRRWHENAYAPEHSDKNRLCPWPSPNHAGQCQGTLYLREVG